ncbi:ribosomal protein S18-alanine N-acetyltransferase [Oscillospiraceae bacterium LTW-04]|nr:ribosomal protein S18-alanine N-acetyltransferase [Oscillospiraceae bacterium MB24-C1]
MKFKVLPVTSEHIPGIAEVEKTCFAQPWSAQSLTAELAKENAAMFVALKSDSEVIGWAGLEHICGEGSVTNVAVQLQERRHGVGEALTRALLSESIKLSLDWLMLEVRTSNVTAISLYRKLGFEPVGIRPYFYDFPREDALLMRHTLDNGADV